MRTFLLVSVIAAIASAPVALITLQVYAMHAEKTRQLLGQ
jgi:hypothetical protein